MKFYPLLTRSFRWRIVIIFSKKYMHLSDGEYEFKNKTFPVAKVINFFFYSLLCVHLARLVWSRVEMMLYTFFGIFPLSGICLSSLYVFHVSTDECHKGRSYAWMSTYVFNACLWLNLKHIHADSFSCWLSTRFHKVLISAPFSSLYQLTNHRFCSLRQWLFFSYVGKSRANKAKL